MFEKTKLILTITYTICFLAYSILVGHFYQNFGIPRSIWIGLCIVLSIIVGISFIMDVLASRRRQGEGNRNK